jgi:isopentenyl-diphosphate delta-isomerase
MDDTLNRKKDHIDICLEKPVESKISNGLERFKFIHEALPDIDFNHINLTQDIFGKTLNSPLFISSMTGGIKDAQEININLARAAQSCGLAMGVGSQRAMLEDPKAFPTFNIRQYAPDILLFGNLGAVQLNYGCTVDDCIGLVERIAADGLILHLNSMQEAFQPEGDVNFSGLLAKITMVCEKLPVPVIVKEVGSGISGKTAKRLFDAGVKAIDVAGAGGTSWILVESFRHPDMEIRKTAELFSDWGISTADSIQQVRAMVPDALIFASGGIRNGVEVAKCLSLGASLVGMAKPFLDAAVLSTEKIIEFVEVINHQIKLCMFGAGALTIMDLQKKNIIEEICN